MRAACLVVLLTLNSSQESSKAQEIPSCALVWSEKCTLAS